MFITGALVLSVLMLAAEKHQATAFAPVRGYDDPTIVDFTQLFTTWMCRLGSVSPYSLVTCMSSHNVPAGLTCRLTIRVQFCCLLHWRRHEHCESVWTRCCLGLPCAQSLGGQQTLFIN